MDNPWTAFKSDKYEIEDLGRPHIFYLPLGKLTRKIGEQTVEDYLRGFLLDQYGGLTMTNVSLYVACRKGDGKAIYECRKYEVSFRGGEQTSLLLDSLVDIARAMGENCLHFGLGERVCCVQMKKLEKLDQEEEAVSQEGT